ncbi:uncharacterized protein N7477_006815 [Penicillium maclennaniae]|uniref:uncharacterized protein n=1 Tax=Penicillium maclennaniae TaxID=1343394 RepID=UPI00253F683D|nr:uncharacterized protein N7477_006815 [Penicillium maclennaniae]KAJ5668245.1 hypothetical protein N7477_006815 [Penicillium maclennaniae]
MSHETANGVGLTRHEEGWKKTGEEFSTTGVDDIAPWKGSANKVRFSPSGPLSSTAMFLGSLFLGSLEACVPAAAVVSRRSLI